MACAMFAGKNGAEDTLSIFETGGNTSAVLILQIEGTVCNAVEDASEDILGSVFTVIDTGNVARDTFVDDDDN